MCVAEYDELSDEISAPEEFSDTPSPTAYDSDKEAFIYSRGWLAS
eukprot:g10449.t1